MARTWQQHLGAEDRRWVVIVRIEGVGPTRWVTQLDATGRYAFCVSPPLYSPTSSLWQPLLTEIPGVLSERASPLGGWPDAGNLTFSLLDRDDILTSVMGYTERAPVAVDTTGVSASEQEWVLGTGEGDQFSYGDCFWCDGECLRIIDVSGDTITVIRGWMGTDAVEHSENALIYASNPYVVGRRAELYIGPADGSSASEQLLGQYVIDAISWDQTTGVWQIQARSQIRYLDQLIRGRDPKMILSGGTRFAVEGRTWVAGAADDYSIAPLWSESTHARVEETSEIVRVSASLEVFARGQLGTSQQEVELGQMLTQVMTPVEGDFRFSEPAVEDRDDPNEWTPSAHFVDILLCLLTSSAAFEDGLELVNYDATTDINWSCLPVGFGLGVPAAEIDFDSFLSVRTRTPGWEFGWYVLGPGKTGREAMTELLEVTGCFLSSTSGRLALVLPRMPLIAEDVPEVEPDTIIREPRGVPLDGSMSVALEAVASSVRYELGPGRVALDIRSADYADTFGQRGRYSRETRPVVIQAPSIAPGDGAWLVLIAAGRLLRWRMPRLEIVRVVDWSLYPDSAPGSIVAVTAEELPDFGTGARGATERPFVVVEREPRLLDGGIMLRMHAWGSGIRAGRISPAAYVASAAPDSGPPEITTLTVEAGRYVAGDNAAGFVAGDKVALINRDGSVHQAGLEVVSVSANTIVIDDDLAGVAGKVLVFDQWSDLTTSRAERYTAFASSADRKIEDAGAPFVHGER